MSVKTVFTKEKLLKVLKVYSMEGDIVKSYSEFTYHTDEDWSLMLTKLRPSLFLDLTKHNSIRNIILRDRALVPFVDVNIAFRDDGIMYADSVFIVNDTDKRHSISSLDEYFGTFDTVKDFNSIIARYFPSNLDEYFGDKEKLKELKSIIFGDK